MKTYPTKQNHPPQFLRSRRSWVRIPPVIPYFLRLDFEFFGVLGRLRGIVFLAFFYLFAGVLYAGDAGGLSAGQVLKGSLISECKDGDSFFIKVGDKFYDVRLWGVDAPELKQKYGKTSRMMLQETIQGKSLKIVYKSRMYQRIVCQVFVVSGKSEKDVAEIMLKSGIVWKDPRFAKKMLNYQKMFEESREAGRGLFADKSAVPPWVYRKR